MIADIFDELLAKITPQESWTVKKWFMHRYGEKGCIRRTKTRRISLFRPNGPKARKRKYPQGHHPEDIF
ncbi:MAG: hypothetical protein JWM20_852 [Patescibacteria group bacterium]|nr:hypothetical protein [Patescibacteria group bacterium]